MEASKRFPRICWWLTVALTLLGVSLRSVAMLTCFDAEIGYFAPGILPTLSDIVYPLAAIAAVVIACLTPKYTLPTKLNDTHRMPAALTMGCALVLFSVLGFVFCFPALPDKQHMLSELLNFLLRLSPFVLALPASLYFLLSLRKTGRFSEELIRIGFIPVLWSAAGIAETYTDLFTTMNSPVKITLQLGFIGFMFIAMAELRFRLGKAAPRLALALLSIGSFLCLSGAIPLILSAFFGKLNSANHIAYAAVLAVCGLYGGYTLLCYSHQPAPKSGALD